MHYPFPLPPSPSLPLQVNQSNTPPVLSDPSTILPVISSLPMPDEYVLAELRLLSAILS